MMANTQMGQEMWLYLHGGRREVVNYDDWFNSTSLWGGGLVYFYGLPII